MMYEHSNCTSMSQHVKLLAHFSVCICTLEVAHKTTADITFGRLHCKSHLDEASAQPGRAQAAGMNLFLRHQAFSRYM